MRLDEAAVSEIRASQDVYRPSDVARHYNVHPSTVKRIWDGELHAGIRPAPEPPNITTRPRPSELATDIAILLNNGYTAQQVADEYGISVASVYAYRGMLF